MHEGPANSETAAKLEELERLCRERGLPRTVQRRAILEVLAGSFDHPTADDLFERVRPRLPGVSRTTVYRVLETLVRLGLASRVAHPGATVRFDARTDRHHHLVCTACEQVFDLDDAAIEGAPVAAPALDGFTVRDYSIQFRGLCASCSRGA